MIKEIVKHLRQNTIGFILRNIKSIIYLLKTDIIRLRKSKLLQIATEYATDKGNTCKGIPSHGYTRVYEHFLEDKKMDIKCICEIGLLIPNEKKDHLNKIYTKTPSLEMWQRYFPDAQIIGFDIKHFKKPNNKRLIIIQGDQKIRSDLTKIIDFISEIDVIIDDGLHASEHQQVSISFLFKYLKPGGIYFIEDLHAQPGAYEKDTIPKTKVVLKNFISTGVWESPVTLDNEKKVLESTIEGIYLFDSLRGENVMSEQDAIAAVVKKK